LQFSGHGSDAILVILFEDHPLTKKKRDLPQRSQKRTCDWQYQLQSHSPKYKKRFFRTGYFQGYLPLKENPSSNLLLLCLDNNPHLNEIRDLAIEIRKFIEKMVARSS